MQNEWLQLLLQYLFAFIATSLVYVIGKFLLRFFLLEFEEEKNDYLQPYYAMVLGLVVIILFFSLIVANGKTINILFVPTLLGLLYLKKKTAGLLKSNANKSPFPLMFLLGSCAFFLLIFHLFPESENQQKDATFYLRLSMSLNNTGHENVFGSAALLGKPFVGTEPYHYLEFWWNAIMINCFGKFLPFIQVLRYISYITICSTGLLGLFALAHNIIKKPLSIYQKICCVVFVFYMPDILAFFNFLQPIIIYHFESNMLERPPLRTLYLFLPGILITLNAKKYEGRVIFWMVGAMVSSALYTAVLIPTTILFCAVQIFIIDFKKRKPFIIIGTGVLISGLFYFIFYHFTQSHLQITSSGLSISKFFVYFKRYWKIVFFSTTTSLVTCFWLPVLLFLYFYRKDKKYTISILKNNKSIVFLCCCILFGIILARWLNFLDDVYQFAYTANAAAAFLFFMLFLCLSNFNNLKSYKYIVVCSIIITAYLLQRLVIPQKSYAHIFEQNGLNLYNGKKLSDKYIQQLMDVVPIGSVIKGGFYADSLFYDTIFHHSYRNTNVFLLPSSYILASYSKFNYEFCLSDSADIIYHIKKTEQIPFNYVSSTILRSPFYQFSINMNTSLAQKRLLFIKNNKLQYLILTKNADTSIITQLPILKKFQDSATGERFYLLDY